jgi:uncharacterized protein YukE
MADVRTLKLNLLADVDQFGKSLAKADDKTKSFSGKINKYGKAMAKSFALAGVAAAAYAVKLGVDGVKSAIEDEKSQVKLAQALRNTTKATDSQIASTEDYISKQQLSFGIADTKLRPALANLARATGDLTKAQKLNNLAIDIAAATGKDLETISLALSKAYNGNLGALTKLGVPLDANIIKTKDFEAATDQLQKLFGGSAQANAKTLEGQLSILRETFAELQEGVGVKVIPILKRLAEETIKVSRAFSGQDPEGLSARARELKGEVGDSGAGSLGRSLKILADSFGRLFGELSSSKAGEATTTMQQLAEALIDVANAINAIANAFRNYKKFYDKVPKGLKDFMNPLTRLSQYADLFGGNMAAGGTVSGNKAYRVGEFGPEMFVPSGSGSIRPASGGGGTTVINLNGIVDAASARRSIERLLQTQSRVSGPINLSGAMP